MLWIERLVALPCTVSPEVLWHLTTSREPCDPHQPLGMPPSLQAENAALRAMINCNVCHQRQKDVVITKCWHMFCQHCIKRNLGERRGLARWASGAPTSCSCPSTRKWKRAVLQQAPSCVCHVLVLPGATSISCAPCMFWHTAAASPELLIVFPSSCPPSLHACCRIPPSQMPGLRRQFWAGRRAQLLFHLTIGGHGWVAATVMFPSRLYPRLCTA